jgi:Transglutaminase-like enzymes, putative cysteine proteases
MNYRKILRPWVWISAAILVTMACSTLSLAPTAMPHPTETNPGLELFADSTVAQIPGSTAGAGIAATETAATGPATDPIIFTNPKKYRVEYSVTVTNGGFTLTDLQVYQPRPVEWDGQKNVVVETVSPKSVQATTDPVYGNGLYYWHLLNTPARGKQQTFTIRFTFTASQTETNVNADRLSPYDQQSPLYKLYTRSERFIESSDYVIVNLADQIAGGETNPYRLAKKFYDYVVDNAHYRHVGRGLLGAKALLTNGEGECGEFASLFIALARAKGIPARPVVGYWAVSGLEQTHVWAEFYLEGIGWIPADPTVGQSQPSRNGIPDFYFGNMDNQRVILNKGFNIPMAPPAPDGFEAALLQGPAWWYWGTDGDGNSVSMDRTSWVVTSIE